MRRKKIIKLMIIPILILGLITAYVTSKKYTRDIYFQTPEDAINYVISNINYGNELDDYKDAISEQAYYSDAMFNSYWYSLIAKDNSNDNKVKELKDNKFIHDNHSNDLILKAIEKLDNEQYKIYYTEGESFFNGYGEAKNEIKRREETLILMVKDGPGWVIDTIASGSYVVK